MSSNLNPKLARPPDSEEGKFCRGVDYARVRGTAGDKWRLRDPITFKNAATRGKPKGGERFPVKAREEILSGGALTQCCSRVCAGGGAEKYLVPNVRGKGGRKR